MDAKSWIQEIRAAGRLMAAGDLAGAESRYRQLLDKGTDDPLHNNNDVFILLLPHLHPRMKLLLLWKGRIPLLIFPIRRRF